MPTKDYPTRILEQFKVDCEVITGLKTMLSCYESQPTPPRYPFNPTANAEVEYIPGYVLLFRHSTLTHFFSHQTSTVYDISLLVNKKYSLHFTNAFRDMTGAKNLLTFRRI